jgi:hypothetical protein
MNVSKTSLLLLPQFQLHIREDTEYPSNIKRAEKETLKNNQSINTFFCISSYFTPPSIFSIRERED